MYSRFRCQFATRVGGKRRSGIVTKNCEPGRSQKIPRGPAENSQNFRYLRHSNSLKSPWIHIFCPQKNPPRPETSPTQSPLRPPKHTARPDFKRSTCQANDVTPAQILQNRQLQVRLWILFWE